MKRSVLKILSLTLCVLLFTTAFVGCDKPKTEAEQQAEQQKQQIAQGNSPVVSTQVAKPSNPPTVAVDETCVLLGDWKVESSIGMTAIAFHADGTATMTYDTITKAAVFTLDGEDGLTITASGTSIVGTYTVDGNDGLFLTESGDAIILTRVTE